MKQAHKNTLMLIFIIIFIIIIIVIIISVDFFLGHPVVFWKDPATKSDEILEKFQTVFDRPLPPLIFGKLYCNFL